MNYYNDNEPFVCRWLENLILMGHIPNGIVDCRPIQEVTPNDVKGFTQCHFFAGVGGWSFALKLAGWPETKPVWTGSCPCQPFSIVGQQKGFSDARHLWPEWFRLIRKSKPPVLFGEQVAQASIWLDLVFSDLESRHYACGAASIPVASIGYPHIRQRLWFVVDANETRWENTERLPASQTKSYSRVAVGVVDSHETEDFRRALTPRKDWIIDGVLGGSHAVQAYGNAIHPEVAAQFIAAYIECQP